MNKIDSKIIEKNHTNSDKLLSTNELIDELRAKLERKSFERAMQYFHMEYSESILFIIARKDRRFERVAL